MASLTLVVQEYGNELYFHSSKYSWNFLKNYLEVSQNEGDKIQYFPWANVLQVVLHAKD